MKGYEFDIRSFNFKQASADIWSIVRLILGVLLVSVSLTVVGYGLVALVYSTSTEKALMEETAEMERIYSASSRKEKVLGDVITGLQKKDYEIYERVFRSEAPNADPLGQLDFFFGSDTIPDKKIVLYTTNKIAELEAKVAKVDVYFAKIFEAVGREDFVVPPMSMPLDSVSYVQIGAGLGKKKNPFFQTEVFHDGLDFIVPRGQSVYAPADGIVTRATKLSKGQGQVIEITHEGGYMTRYAHLSEIKVKERQAVKKGKVIGAVGMSGSSFAPHLHYAIKRDSVYLNPVNYLFGTVSPQDYSNMLFMSYNTKQSMD